MSSRLRAVLLLVVAVALLGCTPVTDEPRAGRSSEREVTAETETTRQPRQRPRRERPERPEQRPRKPERPQKPQRTVLVVHVVDGDTLDLADGRRVRLAGIDTPEAGECGHDRASRVLSRLVVGKRVTLGRTDEDRDRYGRLLRYVDVDGVDAGLVLLRRGLAVARYDSRDGYGFHPREPRYVRVDRRSPDLGCRQPRGLLDAPPRSGGGRCAPGYDPCVPPYPPDVDCGDVGGPVRVTGDDPHGLDADGDGWACE